MTNHPLVFGPLRNASRSFAIAFVLTVPFLLLGCPGSSNKPTDASTPPPASAAKSDFDGDRAFEYVRKQVEFGPRPAGSAELEKTRNYMIDQLKSYGLKVTTDEFHAITPLGDKKMVNVTAERGGELVIKLVAQSERSRTAEEKTRELRQEFSELPFDRKIATLMQLETVAVTEAWDKIAELSASLGKKIFDSVMPDASAKAEQPGASEKGKTV